MNFIPADFATEGQLTAELAAEIATGLSEDEAGILEAQWKRAQELARELAWSTIDMRLENLRLKAELQALRTVASARLRAASCFPF